MCIVAILFVSMFALDAFSPGTPLWEQVIGFLIHLIPSYILILILWFAWKNEKWGGLLFIAIGALAGFAYYYLSHYTQTTQFSTSGILKSIAAGAFLGFFITNSPCARNKC